VILLKTGSRYINFDLVRYVEADGPAGVRICFSGENGGTDSLLLEGEEAAGLKQWLHQNSTEARPLSANWHHTPAGRVEAGG
jgi:hypothetical protein